MEISRPPAGKHSSRLFVVSLSKLVLLPPYIPPPTPTLPPSSIPFMIVPTPKPRS